MDEEELEFLLFLILLAHLRTIQNKRDPNLLKNILFEELLLSAEKQNKRQQVSPEKHWDAWSSALLDISQKH